MVEDESIPFITNTEVDRIVHTPSHLKPTQLPYIASGALLLECPQPEFITTLFPRYDQKAIDILERYGMDVESAMTLLDVTGGDVPNAVKRLMVGV